MMNQILTDKINEFLKDVKDLIDNKIYFITDRDYDKINLKIEFIKKLIEIENGKKES